MPVPDTTLRKLLTAAEQSNNLKIQVALLDSKIADLQSIITELKGRDSITVKYYEGQKSDLAKERDLAIQTIASLNRDLKRERRKRRLTTAAGVLTTGIAIYLGTLKK